jgi:hypothetical protein
MACSDKKTIAIPEPMLDQAAEPRLQRVPGCIVVVAKLSNQFLILPLHCLDEGGMTSSLLLKYK